MARATAITVDGPYSYQGRDGDEYPEWCVCATDDDGDAVGKVYRVHNLDRAITLGQRMANDRRLPLYNEASWA